MCSGDKHPDGKILIIGGGIANFTNVAETFKVFDATLRIFFILPGRKVRKIVSHARNYVKKVTPLVNFSVTQTRKATSLDFWRPNFGAIHSRFFSICYPNKPCTSLDMTSKL